MKKTEIENIVRESVTECADENGWANLARLGPALKAKGVEYGKLSKFFSTYSNLVELKTDTGLQPPVVYARLLQVREPA